MTSNSVSIHTISSFHDISYPQSYIFHAACLHPHTTLSHCLNCIFCSTGPSLPSTHTEESLQLLEYLGLSSRKLVGGALGQVAIAAALQARWVGGLAAGVRTLER